MIFSANALIFVIDSSDAERFEESRKELIEVLGLKAIENLPILIFANKQDKPNSFSIAEVVEKLELSKQKRKWHVTASVATTGEGIDAGFDWLFNEILLQ